MEKFKETKHIKHEKTFFYGINVLSIILYIFALIVIIGRSSILIPYLEKYKNDAVMFQLQLDYYSNMFSLEVLGLFLKLYILLFIICMVIYVIKKNKYKNSSDVLNSYSDAQLKKYYLNLAHLNTGINHIYFRFIVNYIFMLALMGAISVFFIKENSFVENSQIYKNDISAYESKDFKVYEGPLRLDDDYSARDRINSSKIYYFNIFSNPGKREDSSLSLSCSKSVYNGMKLTQLKYHVEYLPNTRTIVSIIDSNGKERLGKELNIEYDSDKYRLIGDSVIKKNTNVFGYDQLNENEQYLFDIMYSGLYAQDVKKGKMEIRNFTTECDLTLDEFTRADYLYKMDSIDYSYPLIIYMHEQPFNKINNKFYASGQIYNQDEENDYNEIFQKKGDEIISNMPSGYSDYEKCLYIRNYILNNVTYYRYSYKSSEEKTDGKGNTIKYYYAENPRSTGYGALILGNANDKGYAEAFDMLAKKAGLSDLLVKGKLLDYGQVINDDYKWNIIKIDGNWYNVDIGLTLKKNINANDYFLISDEKISKDHIIGDNSKYGIIVPRAEKNHEN